MLALAACATGTPRIDGEPGAPSSPASLWPVPAEARTSAPSAEPPAAPEANAALDADAGSGAAGGSGGVQISGTSTTRTQLAPTLTLSHLVFDLGGRAGTIEAAKQRAIAADLGHNATVQNTVLQVESSLFSFLATRALRDAETVAVRESRADVAAAEERERVGVATIADVPQTRTALAQARGARVASMRQQVSLQVFTSYYALRAATGRVRAVVDLLASALRSADVAAGRYREGVGTITDVLLARSGRSSRRRTSASARS